MNRMIKKLTAVTFSVGLLGLCLRLQLYRVGFDAKNILPSSHPLHLACLGLCLLTAAYLLWSLRNVSGSKGFALTVPESRLRALGILAAGCLMAVHGVQLIREANSLLAAVRIALALGCAVSMVLSALMPRGIPAVRIICHGLITLFFAVDMLCRYPQWSGNPQLPDYVFQVFACVLLALTSYYRLAFETGLGKRRTFLFCSLMGLCLCLFCAAGPDTRSFYVSGACWAGACIRVPRHPGKPKQAETP